MYVTQAAHVVAIDNLAAQVDIKYAVVKGNVMSRTKAIRSFSSDPKVRCSDEAVADMPGRSSYGAQGDHAVAEERSERHEPDLCNAHPSRRPRSRSRAQPTQRLTLTRVALAGTKEEADAIEMQAVGRAL